MIKLGVAVIAILSACLTGAGTYGLSNINNSELEWINKYAVYYNEFPETTIVESFKKENDIESYFFSPNEYIEATLLVPNNEIDVIFPEKIRQYNKEYILDLSRGGKNEKVYFGVWMPRTVVKWAQKTQRTVIYTVMQPGDEYTRVYVFVDKLGWNLYH